jgi:acyl-CoA synthetase (AMP-forming)/AMP-acid ligase II
MTIGATLATAAAAHPDKPAFVDAGRTLSYSAADETANRVANALISRGLRPGDRVAVAAHNSIEYALSYFGIARAGAVSLHLSPRMTGEEIAHCTRLADARLALCDPALVPTVAAIGHLETTVSLDPAEFETMCDAVSDADPRLEPDIDAPSSASYTGGTTGFPKGGLHTARSRLTWATIAQEFFRLDHNEIMGLAAPMGHAAGGFIWFQPGVCAAATEVILPHWNVEEFMAAAEAHGITSTFVVPAQIEMLISHPAFDAARLASLRKVVYGGAPSPPGLIARAEAALPACEFIQNYGMTETGPLVTLYKNERDAAPDALGHETRHTECAVFAEPGREAAPGEVGELCFRGPTLMQGYIGDAEQTAAFFRSGDGWGWTGDLAVRDDAGLLTLVGRAKEMIISGGLNIYPAEIERVLFDLPQIAECAVFGLPDETFGELPAVAIVPAADAGEITPEWLLTACGDRLARHKRPRRVEIVSEIPKSPAGKILRNVLQQRFGT